MNKKKETKNQRTENVRRLAIDIMFGRGAITQEMFEAAEMLMYHYEQSEYSKRGAKVQSFEPKVDGGFHGANEFSSFNVCKYTQLYNEAKNILSSRENHIIDAVCINNLTISKYLNKIKIQKTGKTSALYMNIFRSGLKELYDHYRKKALKTAIKKYD